MDRDRRRLSRRRYLAGVGAAATGALAGCAGLFGGDDDDEPLPGELGLADFRGSGQIVEGRPAQTASRSATCPISLANSPSI